MIVFTSPFILSAAAAGVPLDKARIGYQTYTAQAVPSDITVSGDFTSFPKDAPLRYNTHEFWVPPTLPATWQIEFHATRSIDYAAVAAHTLATAGCSLRVEYQLGAGAWTLFATDTVPGTDEPIMIVGTAVNCDRMRFTISGGIVMPQIGVIFMGVALAMEKGVSGPYKPISMARKTELAAELSRTGQFLGQDFRSNGVESDATFKKLSAAWVRTYFDPFSKSARKFPYFFAWNPLIFPKEVGYVWTPSQDIIPEYEGLMDLMQVSWKMEGIGTQQ